MLFNPSTPPGYEVDNLERLSLSSIRGVRVNPALWSKQEVAGRIVDHEGLLRMMRRCAVVGYPVSFLGMDGYSSMRGDLLGLVSKVPDCPVLVDHYGFNEVNDREGDEGMEAMIGDLRQVERGGVKASASFRSMDSRLKEEAMVRGWGASEIWGRHYSGIVANRLEPVFRGLGGDKVMWGSDAPWLDLLGGGVEREIEYMREWAEGGRGRGDVMGKTTRDWYWGMERGYEG
ncbi:hypothetical protein TrRE_jg5891 [Triparma retinervis]|uniref:Amidohydrolase-related domain-containing protein n=1 Tax=Triparma retinervis TaxID=2557542 RepID=A0A9W7L557_9STRA|nr:hypothetical protein TrRE_jg5891 [Triparma retinervis]